jgi:hypothetical protein
MKKQSEFFFFPDEVDIANEILINVQPNMESINKNRKQQKSLVTGMKRKTTISSS